MKVYVIEYNNYSDSYIYGVVEDEEVAMEMIKRLGDSFTYDEFDTKSISLQKLIPYVIGIENNGSIYFEEPLEIFDYKYANENKNEISVEYEDGDLEFLIWAKDLDRAKKIAYDMRAEYLAKKEGVL